MSIAPVDTDIENLGPRPAPDMTYMDNQLPTWSQQSPTESGAAEYGSGDHPQREGPPSLRINPYASLGPLLGWDRLPELMRALEE